MKLLLLYLLINLLSGFSDVQCLSSRNVTRFIRQSQSSYSCALPAQPSWGLYDIVGNIRLPANSPVVEATALTYRCKPGYKFKPDTSSETYCIKGNWLPEIKPCEEVCEKWKDVPHMEMTCKFDGKEVSCDFIRHGTFAELSCEFGYEDFALDNDNVRHCNYGTWDQGPAKCQPVCGKKLVRATALATGGEDSAFGEYPWAVLIFQNRVPICGGTIITPKLAISAAHCFDAPAKGDYEMAAGKYFREYAHENDIHSKYKDFEFYRPSDYKAIARYYENDIAVLVVKNGQFEMNIYVHPVCMDWTNILEGEQLKHGNLGVFAGWGLTKEGSDPANVLQKLYMPFIDKEKCELPDDFEVYLTYDKFCAGFKNGSSPCQGDSGSGLTFRQTGRRSRYYLRGIVSVSPRKADGTCNSREHTLFTLVSKHRDFIRPYLLQASLCALPAQPFWGEYDIGENKKLPANAFVPQSTVLNYRCKPGYKFKPDTVHMTYCVGGTWSPEIKPCEEVCDEWKDVPHMAMTCKFDGKEVPCDSIRHGTLAELKCEQGFEDFKLDLNNVRRCTHGSWDLDPPNCQPEQLVYTNSSCQLPAQPSWGAYDIVGNINLPENTSYVQQSTVLTYRCKPGYKSESHTFLITNCTKGIWSPEIKPCEEVCKKWKDVPHVEMTCKFDGKEVSCDFNRHGTIAVLQCMYGYEDISLDHNYVRRCTHGSWDLGAPHCQPVCGRKMLGAPSLTIGGENSAFAEYPWAVLIYQNRVPICGGTIITPKLVISAAHCFDAPANGDYEMAAGKYFSQYVHNNDTHSQYRKFDFYRPTDYKAVTRNYANDIAVLVVKNGDFEMNRYVSPVCMDWTNNLEAEQLKHGNLGEIANWGLSREGTVLQKFDVPFIETRQCYQLLPVDFIAYFTNDKFCTGVKNGSSPHQGDSGSGLIFSQSGSGSRYYLRGVVSISPYTETDNFNSSQYMIFTLVSKHRDFIQSYLYL